MTQASPPDPAEMDIFNQAMLDAMGGEVVADLSSAQGRTAVHIGRATENLGAIADLAPLDGLGISEIDPARAAELLRIANPRFLCLNGLRTETLDLLASLDRLESLCLVDLARLSDISATAAHQRLRLLMLRGCGRVTDLSSVAGLGQLRALNIEPGGPLAKGLRVDLAPLAGLRSLEVLDIAGTRSPDLSTAALADLPNLRTLDIGGDWPVAELARLAARYPDIEARWLKPLVAKAHYPQGPVSTVLYDIAPADHPEAEITYDAAGLRKPSGLHPDRDARRIAKLRAEWEAHLSSYRAEYGLAD